MLVYSSRNARVGVDLSFKSRSRKGSPSDTSCFIRAYPASGFLYPGLHGRILSVAPPSLGTCTRSVLSPHTHDTREILPGHVDDDSLASGHPYLAFGTPAEPSMLVLAPDVQSGVVPRRSALALQQATLVPAHADLGRPSALRAPEVAYYLW